MYSVHSAPVNVSSLQVVAGPGIESQWEQDFPQPSRPALGPTQPPVVWLLGLFPGGKAAGHHFDHPPPFTTEVKEGVNLYLCSQPGIS
jgi:hypothetical protein